MDTDLQELCLSLGDAVSRAAGEDREARSRARDELRRLLDRASEIRQRVKGAPPGETKRFLSIVLAAEDAWIKLEKQAARR